MIGKLDVFKKPSNQDDQLPDNPIDWAKLQLLEDYLSHQKNQRDFAPQEIDPELADTDARLYSVLKERLEYIQMYLQHMHVTAGLQKLDPKQMEIMGMKIDEFIDFGLRPLKVAFPELNFSQLKAAIKNTANLISSLLDVFIPSLPPEQAKLIRYAARDRNFLREVDVLHADAIELDAYHTLNFIHYSLVPKDCGVEDADELMRQKIEQGKQVAREAYADWQERLDIAFKIADRIPDTVLSAILENPQPSEAELVLTIVLKLIEVHVIENRISSFVRLDSNSYELTLSQFYQLLKASAAKIGSIDKQKINATMEVFIGNYFEILFYLFYMAKDGIFDASCRYLGSEILNNLPDFISEIFKQYPEGTTPPLKLLKDAQKLSRQIQGILESLAFNTQGSAFATSALDILNTMNKVTTQQAMEAENIAYELVDVLSEQQLQVIKLYFPRVAQRISFIYRNDAQIVTVKNSLPTSQNSKYGTREDRLKNYQKQIKQPLEIDNLPGNPGIESEADIKRRLENEMTPDEFLSSVRSRIVIYSGRSKYRLLSDYPDDFDESDVQMELLMHGVPEKYLDKVIIALKSFLQKNRNSGFKVIEQPYQAMRQWEIAIGKSRLYLARIKGSNKIFLKFHESNSHNKAEAFILNPHDLLEVLSYIEP